MPADLIQVLTYILNMKFFNDNSRHNTNIWWTERERDRGVYMDREEGERDRGVYMCSRVMKGTCDEQSAILWIKTIYTLSDLLNAIKMTKRNKKKIHDVQNKKSEKWKQL